MRDFYFEQSYETYLKERKKQIKNVSIILIVLFFMYLLAFFLGLGKSSDISIIALLFYVIFMLIHSDHRKMCKYEYSSDEKWVISLVGTHLSWLSPSVMVNNSNEISFNIDITEIDEIQKSYSGDSSSYMFLLESGVNINPGINNSSIDIDELIEIIQEHGVLLKRVSAFRRNKTSLAQKRNYKTAAYNGVMSMNRIGIYEY